MRTNEKKKERISGDGTERWEAGQRLNQRGDRESERERVRERERKRERAREGDGERGSEIVAKWNITNYKQTSGTLSMALEGHMHSNRPAVSPPPRVRPNRRFVHEYTRTQPRTEKKREKNLTS